MAKPKGIITDDWEHCYICGSTESLQEHHCIPGTGNRKLSDKYGLVVPLCYDHHQGNLSVHQNRNLELIIKRIAQYTYEEKCGSRDQWRKIFGKSYL